MTTTTPRPSKAALRRLDETINGAKRALEYQRQHLARLHALPVEPAGPVLRGGQIFCVEAEIRRLEGVLGEAEARAKAVGR